MALNKHNNFLQSDVWRQFQEAVGRGTFNLELKSTSNLSFEKGEDFDFSASIIEHQLPVVGKYFYVPRGPVFKVGAKSESNSERFGMTNIVDLAKKNNIGWVRIEPENTEALEMIKKNVDCKISKAPHDMQPKEILVMDISKSEEELLAGMKSKTRYNINLAQKRGVLVKIMSNVKCQMPNQIQGSNDQSFEKYIKEFIKLVRLTEKRKNIRFHVADYYRKMLEVIPGDILKLYVAEYAGKVIAANIVTFYGDTATYLHGATDDEYRNAMAPYLLQWQAIKDAKKMGYAKYDLGGVRTEPQNSGDWSGITKFKLGFAPNTNPLKFPGSYDGVLKKSRYLLYRLFSRFKKYF